MTIPSLRRVPSRMHASTLGEYIALTLKARRWSQADLAERAGVNESYISRIVNGKRRPETIGADILNRIATALGEPPEILLAFLRKDVLLLPAPARSAQLTWPVAVPIVPQSEANARGERPVERWEFQESGKVRKLVPQGIRVADNRMASRGRSDVGINAGDWVLYENVLPRNGETVVAAIDDSGGVLIRWYYRTDDLVELRAADGSETIALPPDQVQLLGVVRHVFAEKEPETGNGDQLRLPG